MKTTIVFVVAISTALFSTAQSWHPLVIPTTANIRSSSFINDDEGWIGLEDTGMNAVILHTQNGGVTWNTLMIPNAGSGIPYIDFVNPNVGYALANGNAFKTFDGGINWSSVFLPFSGKNKPYFFNADTGFISGEGALYKTTDGGANWVSLPVGFYYSIDIYFLNTNVGAVVQSEEEGMVFETFDGGQTWSWIWEGGLFDKASGIFITSDSVVHWCGTLWGEGGHVWSDSSYYSGDRECGHLYDLRFKSNNNLEGFAVGDYGFLHSTTNGHEGVETNLPDSFALDEYNLDVLDGFNAIYSFGDHGSGFKYDDFSGVNEISIKDLRLAIAPNPFSSYTTIQFSVSKNSVVEISLYDLAGKKIKTLLEGNFAKGKQQLLLQKENLNAGVYLLQLKSDSGITTQKIIVQ